MLFQNEACLCVMLRTLALFIDIAALVVGILGRGLALHVTSTDLLPPQGRIVLYSQMTGIDAPSSQCRQPCHWISGDLGALDETSWLGKQVIIPNYIQGASNCNLVKSKGPAGVFGLMALAGPCTP